MTEPEHSEGTSEMLVSVSVLLIEDNPGDADLVCEYLEQMEWADFAVSHASTLGKALAALALTRFDVLLVDLSLPDASGLDVVVRLQEQAPEAAIVVLSGREDAAFEVSLVRRGAQDYLPKGKLQRGNLSRSVRHAYERSRSFAQVRSLIMGDIDATLVVSGDGRILFSNPAAERLFARPRLLGETFGYPIGDGASAELEILGSGEPRSAEMRVSRIEWGGEQAYCAKLRDITDRKRAAELQERLLHADRLASIGQLAAGVAHEVNNPAAFIMANIQHMQEDLAKVETFIGQLRGRRLLFEGHESSADELLLQGQVDQRLRQLRDSLRENLAGVERIVKIVRDLKSFSRIEREEVELMSLNDVVEAACSMTFNEVRHRARLVKELGQLPPIAADRAKIAQVVTNLIVNAAHAIEEGASEKNTIHVTTAVSGDTVSISVADSGTGIPASIRQRIFDPFFTTKERGFGTGLGLSVSADIVRRHGGNIRVAARAQGGSIFHVTLPVGGPLLALVPRHAAAAETRAGNRRSRVLVVDDEPTLLRAMLRTLRREHDVVAVAGGELAVEELERNPGFDVILCDLMMPDFDGITLLEVVSERWPLLVERMVFCTGGAFTPRVSAFLAKTRHIVLEKPVPQGLLFSIVDRVASAAPGDLQSQGPAGPSGSPAGST